MSGELTTNFVKIEMPRITFATQLAKGAKRLDAIDLFRGLIMVIMAWDHSR